MAIGAVVGIVVGVSGGGAAPAIALAPAQLWSEALRDALASGSVHEVETAVAAGKTSSDTEDAGLSEGRQDFRFAGEGEADVEVIDSTAYTMGSNTAVLTRYFGFPASLTAQLVGRWVSIPNTNAGYGTVAADVTLPSQISGLTPPQSVALTEAPRTTLDGKRVIGITGNFPQNGTIGGPTTLYVTDSSDPLPVQIDSAESGGHATITLTRWGEPISLTPPANAIPASSLNG